MPKTIEAIYGGKVFRPATSLMLEPNSRVPITIETAPASGEGAGSFLRLARSLNLDGSPDWAANLGNYLSGEEGQHAG